VFFFLKKQLYWECKQSYKDRHHGTKLDVGNGVDGAHDEA